MRAHNKKTDENEQLPWPLQLTIVLGAIDITMFIWDIPGIRTWFVN
jgi:hypothetical protein